MTTTISDGVTSIVPLVVDGYEAARETGNVFHDIIGRADQDVSLAPAKLRSGTLRAVFDSKTDAWAAHTMLAAAMPFTLVDTDHTQLNMTFTLRGRATITLEDETRNAWLVEFGFQEVTP